MRSRQRCLVWIQKERKVPRCRTFSPAPCAPRLVCRSQRLHQAKVSLGLLSLQCWLQLRLRLQLLRLRLNLAGGQGSLGRKYLLLLLYDFHLQ